VIQIGNKGSLDFDFNLATAEPTEFVPSDWTPEEVEFDELPEEETDETEEPDFSEAEIQTHTEITEDDIERFWGF